MSRTECVTYKKMSQLRPRLLVIGSSGFVGGWLARLGRAEWDVIEGARQPQLAGPITGDHESVVIDLAQLDGLRAAFDRVRPSAVILTAAMADIDRCEREQDLTDLVNHQAAVAVARECARLGARLVFTSTDAVFDGLAPPYDEDAAPTPVNFYGRTKAAAEAGIRQVLPDAVIVRPSLVLGFSAGGQASTDGAVNSANNSYLDKFAANMRAGKSVNTPTGELRNPIDVITFARTLLELASQPLAAGVFHIGASDKMTRYELARGLAAELGCSPDLVLPQTEFPPGRAPRGRDDFLACRRLPELTGLVVPTCKQVIHRAVHGTT
jgi:dTDP-4-dehydrorhamnose reductase